MTLKDIDNMPLSAAEINKCQFGCCKATKADLKSAKRTGRLVAHETEDGGCEIRTTSSHPHEQFYIRIPGEAY